MATNTQATTIANVDLSVIRKKRFSIDGDTDRVLELNTSDLNILSRLKEAYPRLVNLADNAFKNLPEIEGTAEDYDFMTDKATTDTIEILKKADIEMRELVDYIFDSNVSEVCVPSGSMYDPINGKFRFEHLIDVLTGLYESDVSKEMGKIAKRVKKHTDKYTRR